MYLIKTQKKKKIQKSEKRVKRREQHIARFIIFDKIHINITHKCTSKKTHAQTRLNKHVRGEKEKFYFEISI